MGISPRQLNISGAGEFDTQQQPVTKTTGVELKKRLEANFINGMIGFTSDGKLVVKHIDTGDVIVILDSGGIPSANFKALFYTITGDSINTEFEIEHNLVKQPREVTVWDDVTGERIYPGIRLNTELPNSKILVTFPEAFAAAQTYTVWIMG